MAFPIRNRAENKSFKSAGEQVPPLLGIHAFDVGLGSSSGKHHAYQASPMLAKLRVVLMIASVPVD